MYLTQPNVDSIVNTLLQSRYLVYGMGKVYWSVDVSTVDSRRWKQDTSAVQLNCDGGPYHPAELEQYTKHLAEAKSMGILYTKSA